MTQTNFTLVSNNRTNAYGYYSDQWYSFNNVDNVKAMTEFAERNGLAGVMAYTIDMDDFANFCECEEFPLLRAINRQLGRLKTQEPECLSKYFN